jgi:hypothetical protein
VWDLRLALLAPNTSAKLLLLAFLLGPDAHEATTVRLGPCPVTSTRSRASAIILLCCTPTFLSFLPLEHCTEIEKRCTQARITAVHGGTTGASPPPALPDIKPTLGIRELHVITEKNWAWTVICPVRQDTTARGAVGDLRIV